MRASILLAAIVGLGFVAPLPAQQPADAPGPADHRAHEPAPADPAAWRMPPMPTSMPMLPQLMDARPKLDAYLPYAGADPSDFPEAVPRRVVPVADGDTLRLEAGPVRRTIDGRDFVLYGYNGQYPGPLIRVDQGSEIVVVFANAIDRPTTVHWHGIRIDNRFDGVPGVTQEPVEPGESFVYRVRFPDAGVYWYHPHHREDVQQDLGLFGNLVVDPSAEGYWNEVNAEAVVTLDDLLIDRIGIFPYGERGASHALMGRFGNVLLMNGVPAPGWRLEVDRGAVVRFLLTNVSNTRTWNVVFEGADAKLVGADISRFEREVEVESVAIAPAQRYAVEVRYDEPGGWPIVNSIQAIDHFWGTFHRRVDTLGFVEVTDAPATPDHGERFRALRDHPEVSAEVDPLRARLDDPPQKEIVLTTRIEGLNQTIVQAMALDTLYFPPVEWNDVMPMMNWISSTEDVRWILREPSTGKENGEIEWTFETGELVKIRITNDARSFHPMQHPIHLHGQRFVVLAKDGVAVDNLAWKDTALVPVGSTFDLLVEMTNPGDWMLHCHIAEHLEAGMKTVFTVTGEEWLGGRHPP